MKTIKSENIDHIKSGNEIQYMNSHQINAVNWGTPPEVKANVSIANDNQNIYLQYIVSEANVLGRYRNINEPVYKDSCVEFFIAFDDKNYYNFEFNCIGTVLAQFGRDRQHRKYLNEDVLKSIKINPSLGRNKIQILNKDFLWQIDVVLPIEVFHFSEFNSFSEVSARCNFYKCGDDLPDPHFLSWKPIVSDTPDFHKPAFFGTLIFSWH